jgi:hypothetical protein
MSSCTYFAAGSILLIVMLKDVPTMDLKDRAIKAELEKVPKISDDDLKSLPYLGEYLLIYGRSYGRLTANKGVTCMTDLKKFCELDTSHPRLLKTAQGILTQGAGQWLGDQNKARQLWN